MKRCNEHALAQTGHAWAPKNWGWDPPTLRKAKGWQGLLSLVKQKFFGSTRIWSQVSSVSEHFFYFYFSFCTQPPRFIKLLITCYRLELQLMAEMLLVQLVFNHISMTVFGVSKLWAELSPEQGVQQKAGIPMAAALLCSMSDITNAILSVYSVTQRYSISLWVMPEFITFLWYWSIAAHKALSFGTWVLEVAELEMHGFVYSFNFHWAMVYFEWWSHIFCSILILWSTR